MHHNYRSYIHVFTLKQEKSVNKEKNLSLFFSHRKLTCCLSSCLESSSGFERYSKTYTATKNNFLLNCKTDNVKSPNSVLNRFPIIKLNLSVVHDYCISAYIALAHLFKQDFVHL